jgi:hypothetical protein
MHTRFSSHAGMHARERAPASNVCWARTAEDQREETMAAQHCQLSASGHANDPVPNEGAPPRGDPQQALGVGPQARMPAQRLSRS